MRPPYSLQRRLGGVLAALLTVLWIGAASVTAIQSRAEMEEVFDSALQETAQRILPLVVADILGREDRAVAQRLAEIREHEELLTYVVRDRQGEILLLSHDADPQVFPAWQAIGFSRSSAHRFYSEDALQGAVRLTIAEPLAHRRTIARQMQAGLLLPLIIVLPVVIGAIFLTLRAAFSPLRRFRERLALRGPQDLSTVPVEGLPEELAPIAESLNGLLGRLAAAFAAERSFAANAAHELRTPLAGAIAQAQRLQAETSDAGARARAANIEATLKRLTRLSERLMQLARAEGGRLQLDHPSDLRIVARVLTDELARVAGAGLIVLDLPAGSIHSTLDPDVFAILFRNLVENALRHGSGEAPIHVLLDGDGTLTVSNAGPVVPAEALSRLVDRFERAGSHRDGSGLGLAIVHAIAKRIGTDLVLHSPRPGQTSGFEASLLLPVEKIEAD
jgi:two-component system OmpR family sensor kinase